MLARVTFYLLLWLRRAGFCERVTNYRIDKAKIATKSMSMIISKLCNMKSVALQKQYPNKTRIQLPSVYARIHATMNFFICAYQYDK